MFGSCKSISGKYSIFRKCYFPERKMFSCVWLHFKKISEKYFLVFGEEEGKDKSRQTQMKEKTARSRYSRDRDRTACRSTSDAITPSIAIYRDERRDRRARSSDNLIARRSRRSTIGALRSGLSLFSLSLSLFFRK